MHRWLRLVVPLALSGGCRTPLMDGTCIGADCSRGGAVADASAAAADLTSAEVPDLVSLDMTVLVPDSSSSDDLSNPDLADAAIDLSPSPDLTQTGDLARNCGNVGQKCCADCDCPDPSGVCGQNGSCIAAQFSEFTDLVNASNLVNMEHVNGCDKDTYQSTCGANQRIGYWWADTLTKVTSASITFYLNQVCADGAVPRAATLNGVAAGTFKVDRVICDCQPGGGPLVTLSLPTVAYQAGRANQFVWEAAAQCEGVAPADINGHQGVYAVVTVQGTTMGGGGCPKKPAGSYNVHDGPVWNQNPPTYTCQETCAMLFGGSADAYDCSINQGNVTRTAYEAVWGNGGCVVNPDNYKASAFFNCARGACSASAYTQYNCNAVNYCFR